jgi:hypothetical protein
MYLYDDFVHLPWIDIAFGIALIVFGMGALVLGLAGIARR